MRSALLPHTEVLPTNVLAPGLAWTHLKAARSYRPVTSARVPDPDHLIITPGHLVFPTDQSYHTVLIAARPQQLGSPTGV